MTLERRFTLEHSRVPDLRLCENAATSLRCLMADCATPACISGDYPYFANVCELSTSVTPLTRNLRVFPSPESFGTAFDRLSFRL